MGCKRLTVLADAVKHPRSQLPPDAGQVPPHNQLLELHQLRAGCQDWGNVRLERVQSALLNVCSQAPLRRPCGLIPEQYRRHD